MLGFKTMLCHSVNVLYSLDPNFWKKMYCSYEEKYKQFSIAWSMHHASASWLQVDRLPPNSNGCDKTEFFLKINLCLKLFYVNKKIISEKQYSLSILMWKLAGFILNICTCTPVLYTFVVLRMEFLVYYSLS